MHFSTPKSTPPCTNFILTHTIQFYPYAKLRLWMGLRSKICQVCFAHTNTKRGGAQWSYVSFHRLLCIGDSMLSHCAGSFWKFLLFLQSAHSCIVREAKHLCSLRECMEGLISEILAHINLSETMITHVCVFCRPIVYDNDTQTSCRYIWYAEYISGRFQRKVIASH